MKKLFFAGLGIFALCVLILAAWLILVLFKLPDVSTLKHYRPAAAAEVLDMNGKILTEYFDRKYRIWVPISSLPDIVIHAVTTAEDDTFFEHRGVNYKATWDALVLDVQKKRFARGGSTITQQMIKNVLLNREKTVTRKIREYVLARKAEELLTKRQILQIYLNEVEWGDDIYGIEAASRYYLDKHAWELNAGEAAMLAGMLPNPRYYNPFKRPEQAKTRQEQVLGNMFQAHLISKEEYESALTGGLNLRPEGTSRFSLPAKNANGRPCYHYALENILLRLFDEQHLYRGGWTIRTTLDRNLQDEMNRMEDTVLDKAGETPGRITVVRQNGRIRAILCTPGKELAVRERIVSIGLVVMDYEVSTVPLDSVRQADIILAVDKEKK